jgi:autotransporter-associated beta strand protein
MRRRNTLLTLASLGTLLAQLLGCAAGSPAQVLFTTYDDFAGNTTTGWSGWGSSIILDPPDPGAPRHSSNGETLSFTGPDFDGATTDGVGDYDNSGPPPIISAPDYGGQPSAGGSLTLVNYQGGFDTVAAGNEGQNSDFIKALTQNGADRGVLKFDFTTPLGATTLSSNPASYFQVGFFLDSNNAAFQSNLIGAAGPGPIEPDDIITGSPGAINNGSYYTGYIPYNISGKYTAAPYSFLQFGILINAGPDYANVGNITLDDIEALPSAPPAPTTWIASSGGNWGDSTNWSAGVPDSIGATADFGPAIAGPSTITLGSTRTVGNINFNNVETYTISAPGNAQLILDNGFTDSASITDAQGTHVFNVPLDLQQPLQVSVNQRGDGIIFDGPLSGGGGLTIIGSGAVTLNNADTYLGATHVNSGTLFVSAPGALPGRTDLTIGADPVQLPPATLGAVRLGLGTGLSTVNTLTIHDGSTLDVTDAGLLILHTPSALPPAAAFNPGDEGVITTTPGLLVGYYNGSTDLGDPSVGPGQLEFRGTLPGDTNLDGAVNITDLLALLNHYGQAGDWSQGDFNYDGAVNITDLLLLLNHYGHSIDPSTGLSIGGDTIAVPEPAAGLLTAGAAILLARRRM